MISAKQTERRIQKSVLALVIYVYLVLQQKTQGMAGCHYSKWPLDKE